MPPNDSLETFGRILYVLNHCEFYVTISDYIRISFIFFLALNSSLLVLKSRFIKVNLLSHNYGLDRNKDLKKGGYFRIPILHGAPSPSSK